MAKPNWMFYVLALLLLLTGMVAAYRVEWLEADNQAQFHELGRQEQEIQALQTQVGVLRAQNSDYATLEPGR